MLCMSGGSSAECSGHRSAAAADSWRSGLPGSDGALDGLARSSRPGAGGATLYELRHVC